MDSGKLRRPRELEYLKRSGSGQAPSTTIYRGSFLERGKLMLGLGGAMRRISDSRMEVVEEFERIRAIFWHVLIRI